VAGLEQLSLNEANHVCTSFPLPEILADEIPIGNLAKARII
jgi:hypothetical protein